MKQEVMPPVLSILVPICNEAPNIEPFLGRLQPVLDRIGVSFEILFINDGSRDDSVARLLVAQRSIPQIRIVDLSRNFGKEAALTAGLDLARGQAAIPIDCDLQDPPETIPELFRHWREEGFEIVRAQRADRSSDSYLKRASAAWFYRVQNSIAETPIPADAGDFCLLDRKVIEALKALPERKRFMKGLFAWVGFRQALVPYKREARSAGESKWPAWKLWNFAIDAITGFSSVPLRLWTYVGAAIALSAFAYASFIVIRTLIYGIDFPGYASLFTAVLFMGGVQLVTLGIIGEYVGRIYVETKGRPLYLVRDVLEAGAAQPGLAPTAARQALPALDS